MALPSCEQFHQFFLKLDEILSLRGAGVAYIGDGGSWLMRPSAHTLSAQPWHSQVARRAGSSNRYS